MKDPQIRKLLLSDNEEDIKVAGALMKKKEIIKESFYNFEDADYYDEILKFKELRSLMIKYPHFIVGGSLALFLHGVRLEKWRDKYFQPDLDIITPYYTVVYNSDGSCCDESGYGGNSGNDFHSNLVYDKLPVDLRVDPLEKYEIIKYRGFDYKVGSLLKILEAKIKYANKGQIKHLRDIEDMIGKSTFLKYLDKINKLS